MIIILLKRSDWNNGNCLRNIFLAAAVQTGDAKVTQRGDIVWNVNRDQLRRTHAVICPRQSTVDNTTDSAQFDDAFRAAMRLRMLLLCVCVCVCCLSGERYITFDEAVAILRDELHYPEDRALHFVKRFDRNKDGRLSEAEFTQFRNKIDETWASLSLDPDTVVGD